MEVEPYKTTDMHPVERMDRLEGRGGSESSL